MSKRFLNSNKIFLFPFGSLSGTRRKILQKRITEEGGLVVDDPRSADFVCLDPKTISRPEVQNLQADLINESWLTDSLKASELLPTESYRLERPFQQLLERPEPLLPAPASPPVEVHLEEDYVERGPNLIGSQLASVFSSAADLLAEHKGKTEEFRARNYRRAAKFLVTTSDEEFQGDLSFLSEEPFKFGATIVEKITEFVSTGKIAQFENLFNDPKYLAIRDLTRVHGIGWGFAEKLFHQGIGSVDDLRRLENGSLLSRAQKIGLKYVDEFQKKIPRDEVAEIGRVCGDTIQRLFGDAVRFEIAGSYRRGKTTCGDVDFVLCSDEMEGKLKKIVEVLMAKNFITDCLTSVDDSSRTFLGVFKLAPDCLHRRIDFKIWPKREFAFALVHFTGDDVLNRKLRYAAKKRGWKLTDHGLSKNGDWIECKTEEEIFENLGFKYLIPSDRNCNH